MGKETETAQPVSPSEAGLAEQAAEGEAKGAPDSGRNQAETAAHPDAGTKPAEQ